MYPVARPAGEGRFAEEIAEPVELEVAPLDGLASKSMHPQRLLLLAALFLSPLAWADIAPPPRESCEDARAGARCLTGSGSGGTCQWRKCSRLDYSNGVPPVSVEYDCLQCIAVAPLAMPSTRASAAESLSTTAPASVPATKGLGWTVMPWAALALAVLVATWLSRRRSQSA